MSDDRKLVVRGNLDDPAAPNGDIYELPNGHRYEMGVSHVCGVDGCPADISWREQKRDQPTPDAEPTEMSRTGYALTLAGLGLGLALIFLTTRGVLGWGALVVGLLIFVFCHARYIVSVSHSDEAAEFNDTMADLRDTIAEAVRRD